MISYGPISLDKLVQQRLVTCVKVNLLEVTCEGTFKRTNSRFDSLRATKDIVQFYDKVSKVLVGMIDISPNVTAKPSQADSLNCVLVSEANGTLLSTQRSPSDTKLTTTKTC